MFNSGQHKAKPPVNQGSKLRATAAALRTLWFIMIPSPAPVIVERLPPTWAPTGTKRRCRCLNTSPFVAHRQWPSGLAAANRNLGASRAALAARRQYQYIICI